MLNPQVTLISTSPTPTASINSNKPVDCIHLTEMSLTVQFNPVLNVRDLIVGLNVGWADCGIRNRRQCIIFFGMDQDILKVQNRFQVSFERLKEWRGIDGMPTFEVSRSCSKHHLSS